jgi:hypothetical protein
MLMSRILSVHGRRAVKEAVDLLKRIEEFERYRSREIGERELRVMLESWGEELRGLWGGWRGNSGGAGEGKWMWR